MTTDSKMINFDLVVTKEQKAAQQLAEVKGRVAARRYQAETSGILLNGQFIDTGRDSQGLINGAAVSAILDAGYVCRWKTPEGFVSLDAETLKTVAKAVRDHVQACFDREEALLLLVDKGTFKDYLLEKGWPSYEPVSDNAED